MAATTLSGVSDVFRGFPSPRRGRAGDPGLFGPGSVVWRVHREAVSILGGGRALLMQIAHPSVAAGVADHSDFRADPFTRLWRTLGAVLTVSFGDTEQAIDAAERVTEIHRRVVGSRDGHSYRALDPDLLLWVHATLVDTALATHERFVGPLTAAVRERYHQEMKAYARAFHVPEGLVPQGLADLRSYMENIIRELKVSEDARRLAPGILQPPTPLALLPIGKLWRLATVGSLPPRLSAEFELRWGTAQELALDAVAAGIRGSVSLVPDRLRFWPHAREAARRMEAGRRE